MNASELYLQDLKASVRSALPFLKGKKVFIAGATGLIGSFLTDALLAEGVFVYAAGRNEQKMRARFPEASDPEHFRFVRWDACEPLDFDEPVDLILHAACAAHPLAYAKDPVGTMMANLNGTRALLELARRSEGSRFLFLSSGEVYGENPDLPDGFSEDSFGYIDPVRPRSCYPESKRAAETLCAGYAAQYGVHALIARLCHVYGPTITPDNSRADAQFLRNALAGEDIILKSTGSQIRSFCYAADAVSGLLTILEKGEPGQAYNIANRFSVTSIREYAQTLADAAHVRLAFDLPPEAEKAGYSKVTRAVLNPSKLEALGWACGYDLKKGLEHTYLITAY